tara:strand:+ start:44 stop:358 length:315 start_codon:yes stop_codon:yes gene_type:complete
MSRSIGYKDQNHGGNWNSHNPKVWKKLREKHRKHKEAVKRGKTAPNPPPEHWDGGAGKGDTHRDRACTKEVYELRYDLAFGHITQEEFDKKLAELTGESPDEME